MTFSHDDEHTLNTLNVLKCIDDFDDVSIFSRKSIPEKSLYKFSHVGDDNDGNDSA